MSRYSRELGVAVVLLVGLGLLAIVAPSFFQAQPLLSLATREAPALLVACGVAMVMLCRQIDISVGSQFPVCGVLAGLLASSGCPLVLVALITVIAGAVLGAFNGVLVAVFRLPSIVVTLATLVMWRDGLRWLRQGQFVNLPDGVQWFGLSQLSGQITVVVSALILTAVLGWMLQRVAVGRWFSAVGSDAEAARLAGIPVRGVVMGSFIFLGALIGLAAMLNVVQSPQVDPKSGTGLELKVIAAAVVGGVSINGGRGRIVGVLLGFLLLATISPALTHLQIEAYWEKAIQGAIILLAVVGEGRKAKK